MYILSTYYKYIPHVLLTGCGLFVWINMSEKQLSKREEFLSRAFNVEVDLRYLINMLKAGSEKVRLEKCLDEILSIKDLVKTVSDARLDLTL